MHKKGRVCLVPNSIYCEIVKQSQIATIQPVIFEIQSQKTLRENYKTGDHGFCTNSFYSELFNEHFMTAIPSVVFAKDNFEESAK